MSSNFQKIPHLPRQTGTLARSAPLPSLALRSTQSLASRFPLRRRPNRTNWRVCVSRLRARRQLVQTTISNYQALAWQQKRAPNKCKQPSRAQHTNFNRRSGRRVVVGTMFVQAMMTKCKRLHVVAGCDQHSPFFSL